MFKRDDSFEYEKGYGRAPVIDDIQIEAFHEVDQFKRNGQVVLAPLTRNWPNAVTYTKMEMIDLKIMRTTDNFLSSTIPESGPSTKLNDLKQLNRLQKCYM